VIPTVGVFSFEPHRNKDQTIPRSARWSFVCPCCGRGTVDPRLPAIVAFLAEAAHEQLTVTSACRCPAHNAAVGGSPTSSHLKGLALDIACESDALHYTLINPNCVLLHQVTRHHQPAEPEDPAERNSRSQLQQASAALRCQYRQCYGRLLPC